MTIKEKAMAKRMELEELERLLGTLESNIKSYEESLRDYTYDEEGNERTYEAWDWHVQSIAEYKAKIVACQNLSKLLEKQIG